MGSSLLADNLTTSIETLSGLQWMLLAQSESFLSRFGTNLWLGLQVAIGLGFVIFVHELGHFLAAKTFGVRCDKFYIGFDVPISLGPLKLPSSLGKFTWGETEYGIGIIPLGGYVKMLGQDDDPRKAEEEAAKLRVGEGEDAPLDPRSYPAKPVWQRMIIISAGVVMNLIFAVILAGVAYWFGVPYTPTVAGTTYAGGPAWKAGVLPGDQILRVGKMTNDAEKIRYDDFATEVLSHGFEFGDKEIPIALRRDGERLEIAAKPTKKYHPDGLYLIGVSSAMTTTIGPKPFLSETLEEQGIDLKPGDEIVGVDGTKLDPREPYNKLYSTDLYAAFQAHWRDPITLSVERPGEKAGDPSTSLSVVLPPLPVKSLGLGFKMGPVTAFQAGSPAKKAGLKVGDIIQSINGQEIENALAVPVMAGKLAGQDLVLSVLRPSSDAADEPGETPAGETLEITFENVPDATFDTIAWRSGELTLGGVGVAFSVSPFVASVDQAAADAGFQAGDELMQVLWVVDEAEKKSLGDKFNDRIFEPMKIDDAFTVPCLFDVLQGMPEGAELSCTVRRDGIVSDPMTLVNKDQQDWFWHERGLLLSPLKDIYTANGFVEAAGLGFWETKRRFTSILNFLKLLVTGRIGAKGLGGPGRIAYVAANEASNGPARLLIFLTMLSANLAILNFLPIPALDGGHMVFLTAEAVMGKPVNEALQIRLTMLGVLGLLSLMAFVIYRDILFFAS